MKHMTIRSLRRNTEVTKAILKEQVRTETAYLASFWADILSASAYVATTAIFIDLLIRRSGLIAGYSRNDFYFMMLINQITYFGVTKFLVKPMFLLVESVRSGNFDHMLLRPMPLKLNLYTRAIQPVNAFTSAAPSIIIFSLIVDWSKLNIDLGSLLAGIVVWLAGFVIYNTYIFTLAYPVFSEGDSTDALSGFYWSLSMNQMPYQKLPWAMKSLSLFLMPSLLMTAGSVAVILSKGSAVPIVVSAVIASIISAIIFSKLWKRAINNYSSASS